MGMVWVRKKKTNCHLCQHYNHSVCSNLDYLLAYGRDSYVKMKWDRIGGILLIEPAKRRCVEICVR